MCDRSPSPGGSERDVTGAPRDLSARSDISADSIERNGGGGVAGFERSQARFLEELRSRNAKIVQVTYPRTANNDKELTVIRGEYLEVRLFEYIQSHPNTMHAYTRLSHAAVACRLAGHHTDAASTLSLLFQFIFRVYGHAHQRTFAKRRH